MTNDVTTLVDALITKMERMDGDVGMLQAQNMELRKMVSNPDALLQKAGFVKFSTPATEHEGGDPLRGEANAVIEKGDIALDGVLGGGIASDNADCRRTAWEWRSQNAMHTQHVQGRAARE